MYSRRGFLGVLATAGAGTVGLGGCVCAPSIGSSRAPNGRLKFAAIGCGMQGQYDISVFETHRRIDMAAFCDVDLAQMEPLRKKFPKANFYQDWRTMLDREAPDAVLVATPDHWHCEIMAEVMRRGIHLYAQKPLCRSFAEAHRLDELAVSSGVVTQLGTQVAAWECDRHTSEMIRRGDVGTVKKVWLFSNSGFYAKLLERKWPLETAPVPSNLDWKAWLGPAPYRPYVPNAYAHFAWRAWRDFGSGWLGDMGSHLFSPVWQGMELGRATIRAARASVFDAGWTGAMKEQFLPLYSHVVFDFAGVEATGMRDFEVEWCDGPASGGLPDEFLPPASLQALAAGAAIGKLPLQGRVIEGTDGWLISTHYNRSPVVLDSRGKVKNIDLPFLEPSANHYHEFVDCCLDGGKARSDLHAWTTRLTEWILLGNAAIARPDVRVEFPA